MVAVGLALALASCGRASAASGTPADASVEHASWVRPDASPPQVADKHREGARIPWGTQLDWDGDGALDRLELRYTGGAHCCYRIRLEFGGSPDVVELPFDLDGGYVGGNLGSDPKRLRIQQGASLPELVAEIATYGGKPGTIPREWKQKYGVRSHLIAISFPKRVAHVRNLSGRSVGRASHPSR